MIEETGPPLEVAIGSRWCEPRVVTGERYAPFAPARKRPMRANVLTTRHTIVAVANRAVLATDEVLDRVLTARSPGFAEVRVDMAAAHDAAWSATSPRLLELCRVRMATMLGCAAEATSRTPDTGVDPSLLDAIAAWPHDPRFDDADRACLAFTEHYVIDVASVGDDTVAEVRAHLGDSGLADFVSALLVVEQRIRLRLSWARLSLDADTGTPTTEGDH